MPLTPCTSSLWISFLLALTVVAGESQSPQSGASPPGTSPNDVSVKIERQGDEVRVEKAADGVTLHVHSPSGIGKATVKRSGDAWPEHVSLRLYLKGLESLRIVSGRATLEIAVSSHEANSVRLTLRTKRGGEKTIDKTSPYWTEVKREPAAEKSPPSDGCFVVPMPAELLKNNPRELRMEWIDFYRC
jgi:hypothetical protein